VKLTPGRLHPHRKNDVPVLADLKPSGKYIMSELVEIGGIQP
jgi:dihydroxyacid dehydratase/phosphogluconate dehydratase